MATLARRNVRMRGADAASGYLDPLDADRPGDEVVALTRRGLARVALVAADTATRFAREGVAHEPMAWMLAPRRLFGGRSAIEACTGRTECRRAVVMHALSMGLDCDPASIDELVGEEDRDEEVGVDAGRSDLPMDRALDGRAFGRGPALWTCLMVERTGAACTYAFDAFLASTRQEATSLLAERHGIKRALAAEVMPGFDRHHPVASGLVSTLLADLLEEAARDPSSPASVGIRVSIEQRIAA